MATKLVGDSSLGVEGAEKNASSPCGTDALSNFLVKLGALLLKYGAPTQRIESVLRAAAKAHHHSCEVFAVPTGLWVSLLRQAEHRPAVRLIRVYGWETDLRRLLLLDGVFNAVASGELNLTAAMDRLEEIDTSSTRYKSLITILAGVCTCGAAAFLFGGGLRESCVGAFLGFAGGVIGQIGARVARIKLLVDFLIGVLTGVVVWGAMVLQPDLIRRPMLLAGIVVVVPGMTLTVGLGELAHKQLVSGGARLLHAGMVLVSMVLGITVVVLFEHWTGVALPAGGQVEVHSFWVQAVSAVIAGTAFAVLFSVPKGSWFLAILSCPLAWLGSVGTELYLASGAMASFVGALILGLYANWMARLTDRPGQIFLLPGLILLVPGTMSFLGLGEFLRGDALKGAAYLFETLLNAGALTIGLVLASVALPPRKLL